MLVFGKSFFYKTHLISGQVNSRDRMLLVGVVIKKKYLLNLTKYQVRIIVGMLGCPKQNEIIIDEGYEQPREQPHAQSQILVLKKTLHWLTEISKDRYLVHIVSKLKHQQKIL